MRFLDHHECTAFLRVIQRFSGIFGRHFRLNSKFFLFFFLSFFYLFLFHLFNLIVARICWKLLNPLFTLCQRIFSSSQQKFSPKNQILARCWLWKTPRATEKYTFWCGSAAQRCQLYKKSGARCCPNVVTSLTFLKKSFFNLDVRWRWTYCCLFAVVVCFIKIIKRGKICDRSASTVWEEICSARMLQRLKAWLHGQR